nr:MAG TPA: hypothetical protein [Caudoviricetes sp.]
MRLPPCADLLHAGRSDRLHQGERGRPDSHRPGASPHPAGCRPYIRPSDVPSL